MAAKIDSLLDEHGGRGISKESGAATYKELFEATLAELTDLRAKWAALLAKLDTDFTAQNIAVASSQLDEDYAATLALADAELE